MRWADMHVRYGAPDQAVAAEGSCNLVTRAALQTHRRTRRPAGAAWLPASMRPLARQDSPRPAALALPVVPLHLNASSFCPHTFAWQANLCSRLQTGTTITTEYLQVAFERNRFASLAGTPPEGISLFDFFRLTILKDKNYDRS